MTEDRDLIKRTLAGERGAFDEIVARYQDGLFRHLLRLTGRPEEAEDLCQEAFIGLYRSLRRFNTERPLVPFLFTIATNAWKKRLRDTRPEVPMSYEAAGDGDPVAETVFERLEYQRVLTELMRLQPEQREVVSLFYDQGLSYREISGITGAPVGTVSARLKRGLENLRQALAAGLVIPAGVGDLPQYLTSVLQGQATAPGSIGPAVAHGITTLAPGGAGLLAYWEGVLVMKKAIYVAIGLAVAGGTVVGVPRLLRPNAPVKPPAGQVEVAKAEVAASAVTEVPPAINDREPTKPARQVDAARLNSISKESVPLAIACSVTWKGGGFGVDKLYVTLEPSTSSPAGPGKMIIAGFDVPAGPVPTNWQKLESSASFNTIISMEEATEYILKITVPPGWKATPAEYRFSQNISNADFFLEKIAQ